MYFSFRGKYIYVFKNGKLFPHQFFFHILRKISKYRVEYHSIFFFIIIIIFPHQSQNGVEITSKELIYFE